ncbi:MAG: HAD-IA family hydrolase [Succinivibrionaceae bacterium]|nr:HAD-IA family hydrolase [Succinivibrionaceae bacterium]
MSESQAAGGTTANPDGYRQLERYRGLIFDLDGTLVDSMQYHIRAWQEVGAARGLALSYDYLMSNGGRPSLLIAREIIARYHLPDDEQDLQREKTANYVRQIPNIAIYPAMRSLLEYAHARSIPMIIGTGTLRSNVEAVMRHTGLDAYVSSFVSSEMVKAHKPAPDTFVASARAIGQIPEDCLVFEDAPLGIEAARRGGMDCCVVKDGRFSLDEIIRNRSVL